MFLKISEISLENTVLESLFKEVAGLKVSHFQHDYDALRSRQGNLINSSYRCNRYGKYSIITNTVDSWNKIQKQLKNTLLKDISLSDIKTVVSNFYLKSY